jgi:transposase, IS30 family
MNTYQRLNLADREEISRGLAAGWTFSHIAHNINKPVSTVTREVWSNCTYPRTYRAGKAEKKAQAIRHRNKQPKLLETNTELQSYVLEKLRLNWSPQEIARRLKRDYASDMTMRISHESIYTYIYCLPRGSLKKELVSCLRQERKLRHNRKNSHSRRGAIQDAISIDERPSEVADRIVPGHWEGDLIMGSKRSNSALGTLVERTTRYLLLVPLEKHDAYTVRLEFAKAVKTIPRRLKKTLTYDRGSEMAQHKLFTKDTKIQVYFADPYSPWQRGTNENTNGLLRQYFPKGIDFKTVSKKEILWVQDQVNDRPRKALDFLKPDEAFSELLLKPDFALEG